jgi:hypothetical protein
VDGFNLAYAVTPETFTEGCVFRRQAERYRNPDNPERFRVLLEGPIGASVQAFSGQHLNVASDETLELSADDAQCLISAGWRKLGEWIEDEPIEESTVRNPCWAPACALGSSGRCRASANKNPQVERLVRRQATAQAEDPAEVQRSGVAAPRTDPKPLVSQRRGICLAH